MFFVLRKLGLLLGEILPFCFANLCHIFNVFNKYLLRASCVPDTVLGAEEIKGKNENALAKGLLFGFSEWNPLFWR